MSVDTQETPIAPVVKPAKRNLIGLDFEELTAVLVAQGMEKFRAKQVWSWVYCHGVREFGKMTTLARPIREMLRFMSSMVTARRGLGKIPLRDRMSRVAGLTRKPAFVSINSTRCPASSFSFVRTDFGIVICPLLVIVAVAMLPPLEQYCRNGILPPVRNYRTRIDRRSV